MDCEETWFVIECEDDDSLCLIKDKDVVCDESVKKGDKVRFFYNGKIFDGVVEALGGNHDDMKKVQEKLNSKKKQKNKRDSSFKDDKPRKAAVSCRNVMKTISASKNTRSSTKVLTHQPNQEEKLIGRGQKTAVKQHATTNKNTEPQQVLAKLDSKKEEQKKQPAKSDSVLGSLLADSRSIYSSDTSSSDENDNTDKHAGKKSPLTDKNDSSSSCEESVTAEELKSVAKLSKKNRHLDFQALLALARKSKESAGLSFKLKDTQTSTTSVTQKSIQIEGGSGQSSADGISSLAPPATTILTPSEGAVQPSGASQAPPVHNVSNINVADDVPAVNHSSSDERSGSSEAGAPSTSKKRVQRPKVKRVKYQKLEFHGEYFCVKASDEHAFKLSKNHNVYVNELQLKELKRNCKTSTALGRALLKEVFTKEAIAACSVTGRPATGKRGGKEVLRPPLHASGVAAIYDFTVNRASKKGWPQTSFTAVKKAMGDVLCEERYYSELIQADSNNDPQ